MEHLVVEYRLKIISVGAFTKLIIYTYDPSFPDSHAKPFCCMTNHNHVYVLRYDLKSLSQKHIDEGDTNPACAS